MITKYFRLRNLLVINDACNTNVLVWDIEDTIRILHQICDTRFN